MFVFFWQIITSLILFIILAFGLFTIAKLILGF